MGEAAEVTGAGDGGSAARDGGARCTREVRGRSRAARSAAQHTVARRRVWAGRASTVTSPLSASRADEKQLPASTEQVRERRAGVGGRCGGGRGAARQEGRAAAEGDALVGAHGRAAGGAVPAGRGAAAVRDGAAPRRARAARAARRVTARAESTLTFHIRAARAARAPDSYRLAIYLFGSAAPRPCSSRRLRVSRKLRLR